MKFNIEVEIDWLEEGNIDEELRSEVVSQLLSSVRGTVSKQVESMVYNQARNCIHGWIMEELHKFADRPLRITGKWGDTVENHDSLTDMFKQQFDAFFSAAVDKDGKLLNGCGYGPKLSRIDYLLDKKASDYLKQITDKIDRDIKRTIDKATEASIKEKIIKHTSEQVAKLTDL